MGVITAVVIGNGLSREGMDLDALRDVGHTIGCNWLYRDWMPDTLVTIDTPPQHEIIGKYGLHPPFNHLAQNVTRTHALLNRKVLCKRPSGPYWNNSGVMATWYAAAFLEAERIYLVGVDFFRATDRKTDAGKPTNDIYGINTIGRAIHLCFKHLALEFPDVELIRVGPVHERDSAFYDKHIAPYMTLQDTL